MDIFKIFKKKEKKKAGAVAEDRLKFVLSKTRRATETDNVDMNAMEDEIINVVKKYINNTDVVFNSETEGDTETISIEVKF